MGANEACRTPKLGGHVEVCDDCGTPASPIIPAATVTARVSRHGAHGMGSRPASPISCRSRVSTWSSRYRPASPRLPSTTRLCAFNADRSSDAADGRPRPQAAGGAKIGIIAVLHTWGQAMPHHPHVHCVVPGGGLSPDKSRWFACRPGFFLPVRILSRVFRRLFAITHAFAQGELRFSNRLAHLKDPAAFTCHLAHAAARMGRLRQATLRLAGPGPCTARAPYHLQAQPPSRRTILADQLRT